MYSEYNTFEELKAHVIADREQTGLDVSTRNRYPIRFVLFDNFRDCSQFVDFVQEDMDAIVQSVDKWIDPDYPDIMITYTELAERIQAQIKKMDGVNCVIAPFSELARFYENDDKKTFDALLKTIKATESSSKSFASLLRTTSGYMCLSSVWRVRWSLSRMTRRVPSGG